MGCLLKLTTHQSWLPGTIFSQYVLTAVIRDSRTNSRYLLVQYIWRPFYSFIYAYVATTVTWAVHPSSLPALPAALLSGHMQDQWACLQEEDRWKGIGYISSLTIIYIITTDNQYFIAICNRNIMRHPCTSQISYSYHPHARLHVLGPIWLIRRKYARMPMQTPRLSCPSYRTTSLVNCVRSCLIIRSPSVLGLSHCIQ